MHYGPSGWNDKLNFRKNADTVTLSKSREGFFNVFCGASKVTGYALNKFLLSLTQEYNQRLNKFGDTTLTAGLILYIFITIGHVAKVKAASNSKR